MLGDLQGVGEITICQIDDNYPRQLIPSPYDNWGEMAAMNKMLIDRWCIKLAVAGKPADARYVVSPSEAAGLRQASCRPVPAGRDRRPLRPRSTG